MNRRLLTIIVLSLPVMGGVSGYFSGPFLARAHDTVQLAERIWVEDSRGLTEQTFESEAFRGTGRPREELFAEARQVERSFVLGGTLVGIWCGLVVSAKLLSLARVPGREVYDMDPGACVACGRCFMACPQERSRLKDMGQL